MKPSHLLPAVKKLARQAGEIMTQAGPVEIHIKGDHDFVTQRDLAVNDFLLDRLPSLLDGARILTEESEEHHFQPEGDTWILDPIDGTSNFIFDMQLSCVSIGLIRDGESVLGVIYNPYTGELFSAAKGQGAFLNHQPIQVNTLKTVRESLILCETNPYGDRTTGITQNAITRVFQDCVDYRVLGAAALDICYVACGRGSAFMCEIIRPWDYAAGEIILREAGGISSHWDGTPLTYIGPQSYLGSNTHIHQEMLEYLQPQ